MKRRVGVLVTVSGTMLLVLSMVLSTVAFAASGSGLPRSPGADVKYMPPQQGSCTGDPECDDGDPCTTDQCVGGTCQHALTYEGCCDTAADCFDGSCNGWDSCQITPPATTGTCTETAPPCGILYPPLGWDDYTCTDEVCTEGPGGGYSCSNPANDALCADESVCTSGEVCNPSAQGADPTTGCFAVLLNCSDDDVCNGLEYCDPVDGCQSGEPLDCDDDNPCTYNNCDPVDGCENPPVLPQDEPENCDSDPCTYDYCLDGQCVWETCDDYNVCNGVEYCEAGVGCQSGEPLNCDDGMACTIDWCDEEVGCLYDYSGCECSPGTSLPCGTDVGDCSVGYRGCAGGRWGQCVGGLGPTAELCDGRDNDCDGSTDEGDVCAAVMLGRPGGQEVAELPSTGAMPLISGLSVSSMALASLALIGGGLLLRRRR